MTQAVGTTRFPKAESKAGNLASINLTTMVKKFGWILLRTLQVIGFMILSTFWLWPGLVYLLYMAMVS